ncbi:TraX family protein [Stenotrophomonas indicatrix]|uniref:TraX family protein n=1 Tax=Stenotrophomonas indicatrix TaxID=2045451 RepID=UPI0028E1C27D|nr:TraX family protein [Stenotrophomonas indicatrix]MDT9580602.1 TraX family protein [Stenotrophomonas indicatrix]
MSSGGRELLKWLALALMTGDHLVKVFGLGYVPLLSELGRVAFPVFALVMAYNLAQPGADVAKATKRLALWGLVASPAAYLAFGTVLPLNVLLTFAAAAACIWAYERRKWALAAVLFFGVPFLVDYQWAGVWLVVEGWFWFSNYGKAQPVRSVFGIWEPTLTVFPFWVWACMGLLCWYNGNAWALIAIPVLLLAEVDWAVPRSGRFFYLYYVGHLVLMAAIAG